MSWQRDDKRRAIDAAIAAGEMRTVYTVRTGRGCLCADGSCNDCVAWVIDDYAESDACCFHAWLHIECDCIVPPAGPNWAFNATDRDVVVLDDDLVEVVSRALTDVDATDASTLDAYTNVMQVAKEVQRRRDDERQMVAFQARLDAARATT